MHWNGQDRWYMIDHGVLIVLIWCAKIWFDGRYNLAVKMDERTILQTLPLLLCSLLLSRQHLLGTVWHWAYELPFLPLPGLLPANWPLRCQTSKSTIPCCQNHNETEDRTSSPFITQPTVRFFSCLKVIPRYLYVFTGQSCFESFC